MQEPGNWTWVKSSSTVVDAQLSANAFHEGGDRKTLATLGSTDVGLPAYLDEKCAASDESRTGSTRGGSCALPIVTFGGGAGNYQQFGKNAAEGYDTQNLQFTANMTHVRAAHTLKFGTDMRRHSRTGFLPGASQGSYTFDSTYTRRYSDTALYTPGNLGLSWAAFMLGIPTTSTLNTPVDYATSSPYYSAFAQEAWRATSKLTVNVGLRFEFEQGMTEKNDRMITSFDPDFVPAFADEVVTAYARNPIPEVSVSAFRENLRGGAVYAGEDGQSRRGWKSQVMWLPRASAAYQVNDGMVVKGGYGVYYDSLNATAITPNQLGFSTVTTVPSSNDFGQTWASGNPRAGISPLVDPFPVRADGTRFVTPVGRVPRWRLCGRAVALTGALVRQSRPRARAAAAVACGRPERARPQHGDRGRVCRDVFRQRRPDCPAGHSSRAVLESHRHAQRGARRPKTTETFRIRSSSAT